MKHCINKLESNINIQCIKIYCMCALHLFDTTNGLQKKTCKMFRIEVRNLYLTYFHYELALFIPPLNPCFVATV